MVHSRGKHTDYTWLKSWLLLWFLSTSIYFRLVLILCWGYPWSITLWSMIVVCFVSSLFFQCLGFFQLMVIGPIIELVSLRLWVSGWISPTKQTITTQRVRVWRSLLRPGRQSIGLIVARNHGIIWFTAQARQQNAFSLSLPLPW